MAIRFTKSSGAFLVPCPPKFFMVPGPVPRICVEEGVMDARKLPVIVVMHKYKENIEAS